MEFFIIIKANANTEAGIMPSTPLLQAMGDFNQRLSEAGVLVSGNGLHPSSRSARVHFSAAGHHIEHGPFALTEDTISGYWVWRLPSLDAACDWAAQIPNPDNEHYCVDIRPIFSADDFGGALTPELREREEKLARQ